ncbi:MAG: hypothetical protein WCH76_00550 [Candidatus Riflemargulisbacteria bacterium]
MFNNKQKTIIVFSMLGEVFSDNILRKLPADVFEKVQEEILPYVGKIPMPDDIDAFVLDNILKDEELLDMDEVEEEVIVEVKEENILNLEGDAFLDKVSVEFVFAVLKQEKPIFQSFLLGFFDGNKQNILVEMMVKEGINLTKDFQKTAILEGIEVSVKKEFIDKIKIYIKKEKKV